MRSLGRKSSPGARLCSKARNAVSALGAFQRPSSSGDFSRSAGMTESMSPPRKRSTKGCIALGLCLAFIALVVNIGAAVGVTESKKHHDGAGDGDRDGFSVTGICSGTFRRRLLHFHDMEGEFPHWFSREGRQLLQFSNPTPNSVVAKDGSGRFSSIQAAVNATPSGFSWVIYVKRGVYSEYVSVPKDKMNLMMYGDGPGQTVITGNKSVKGSGVTTSLSATFAVVAPGFIGKDMTIRNTAGAAGEQAMALRAGGDRQAFSNVNLEGYQDTLYAHKGRQFYTGCTIIGTIDYIFGNAAAVFQNCNLQARLGRPGSQNIYTASGRTDPGHNTGLSFLSCTVGAAPGLPDSYPTYLGRPWKPYAQTVFIKSSLAKCVNPAGWLLWNGDPKSGQTVNYGEYGNTGQGPTLQAGSARVGKSPPPRLPSSRLAVSLQGRNGYLPLPYLSAALSRVCEL